MADLVFDVVGEVAFAVRVLDQQDFASLNVIPAQFAGCDLVLERLTPFENSNRIPATIVAASVPELRADGGLTPPPARDLGRLVDAVSYCMQPTANPDLRPAAEAT